MKKILFAVIFLFGIITLFIACENISDQAKNETHFQCPMDCEKGKTYSENAKCPVCKMNLKEVGKDKKY